MRTVAEIDAIMQTIPERWRKRWCGAIATGCACMGCVQIGNRIVMAEEVLGHEFVGDPERIDIFKIPPDIFSKYKLTEDEWRKWSRAKGD